MNILINIRQASYTQVISVICVHLTNNTKSVKMFSKGDVSKSLEASKWEIKNRNSHFHKHNIFREPSYIHHIGEQPLKYITIGRLLAEAANKFGQRKAIISVHQNKFLTFSDLLQKADKLAASLKILNLEKNDRLGIWAPNLLEWYITMMGCARAGLIAVSQKTTFARSKNSFFFRCT